MPGTDIRIKVAGGGRFDCYLATPAKGPAPGLILACAVTGVDADLRAIADRFAAAGFVVAAPDLFWRTDPGPLPRTEEGQKRAAARAQPRAECIARGVQDIADTAAMLRARPDCNGKVAAAGFCYGGPYAVLGQTRAGLDAGFAYHGTQVHYYLGELKLTKGPVSLHWGDQDHAAPAEALKLLCDAVADMPSAEVHVYPGVKHGYTASTSQAWDAAATDASLARTIELLRGLGVRAAAAE